MSYYIPSELVSEIVHHLLDNAPPRYTRNKHGKNTKPSWELIQSFTLVCKGFRDISLAQWFRALFLEKPKDLDDVDKHFPMIKVWCRRLHVVQTKTTELSLWDLDGFENVSYLRMDWVLSGDSTFYCLQCPFSNVKTIEEFDLRGLKYPSPMTLYHIVTPLTNLKTLRFDFPMIMCSLCNTCNPIRFPSPSPGGSPVGFVYEGGLGLPYHYALCLKTLEKLEEVFIRLPDIGPRLSSPGISGTSNENMWMGECDRCMTVMYEDQGFLRMWLDRKKGNAPTILDTKWSIYPKPPGLKKVYWDFWKLRFTTEDAPYSLVEIASEEPLADSDDDEEPDLFEEEEDDGETPDLP